MSREQLRKRCPSAVEIGIGHVSGYTLVFNRKGTYRNGGVASIECSNDPEDSVFGVIWRLNNVDFDGLDSIEDPTAYERKSLRIRAQNGETFECQVYIAFPQDAYIIPDPDYLNLMLEAAKEVGLPKEYITKIANFQER